MNKEELGLTNRDIATIINHLSDDDFLEVFEIIGELNGLGSDNFGMWINTVLNEIREEHNDGK